MAKFGVFDVATPVNWLLCLFIQGVSGLVQFDCTVNLGNEDKTGVRKQVAWHLLDGG